MIRTLIIGGTAAYHLNFDEHVTVLGEETLQTPFGPAGPVLFFRIGLQEAAFLSRHGGEGRLGVTPPFVNYHANLWVAKLIGAERVLSWNSVGSLIRSLQPGTMVAVSDVIDWTKARRSSFGRELAERAAAARPLFDPDLRMALVRAAQGFARYVGPSAVYAATEGARLETASEIRLLAQSGAEMVGMTMVPEVYLAHELGVQYGALCWVANYATDVPFDGPEQRLFGPEVGPLLLRIMLHLLQEENAHG